MPAIWTEAKEKPEVTRDGNWRGGKVQYVDLPPYGLGGPKATLHSDSCGTSKLVTSLKGGRKGGGGGGGVRRYQAIVQVCLFSSRCRRPCSTAYSMQPQSEKPISSPPVHSERHRAVQRVDHSPQLGEALVEMASG